MTPIVFICAAGAASLYAAGSLQIKRSLNAGAPKRRAIAVTNVAMALWALPLFFISRGDFELSAWLTAVGAGVDDEAREAARRGVAFRGGMTFCPAEEAGESVGRCEDWACRPAHRT